MCGSTGGVSLGLSLYSNRTISSDVLRGYGVIWLAGDIVSVPDVSSESGDESGGRSDGGMCASLEAQVCMRCVCLLICMPVVDSIASRGWVVGMQYR